MPDFIDSLPFLSDEQRKQARAADLDVPAAIVVLTAAEIATHTGLSIGKAGLLLAHARAATTAAVGPSTTEADRIYQAKRAALELALQALRAEPAPHRRKAIRDMGVECVVRDAEGKVNPAATMAMLADLEDGAPVPKTWQGEQVVLVRDIGLPTVFCHPRTHEVLQGGTDEKTKIPWKDLGIEGMRLATYAYREGMVYGMSDRAVFESIRDNVDSLRDQLQLRAKNLRFDLAEMDAVIVYQAPESRPEPVPQARPQGPLRGGQLSTGGVAPRLASVLMRSFSGDEMRRFVRYLPGGEELSGSLPGPNASPASVADAIADILRRHNRIDRDLRNRMVAERPGRAADIDAFFDSVL